jgi:hypothetical protein
MTMREVRGDGPKRAGAASVLLLIGWAILAVFRLVKRPRSVRS